MKLVLMSTARAITFLHNLFLCTQDYWESLKIREKTVIWNSLGHHIISRWWRGTREIKPVNPKGNWPWILIGRTDAETEAPIIWPPDVKSQLTGKDPSTGKDEGQEEKGVTEDEMAGWHHQLNGHEFEQTLGDSEKQGSLACCSPCVHRKSDMT